MTSQSHSAYVVGYNVQSAVDTKHHLIVAHDVTSVGIDKGQLSSMAKLACDALKAETIEVFADKCYFKSEEIAACEDSDVTVYVPKPATSNACAHGRFYKGDFIYDKTHDVYLCPAGQNLTYHMTGNEDGRMMRSYWTNACEACSLKSDCTTGKERCVRRWEREDILERVQQRLDRKPDAMMVRRSTVEHPFGTIKARMGATHFLTKRLTNVATEMALHVLAYNMKRVMNVIGVPELIKAIAAFLAWTVGYHRSSNWHQVGIWNDQRGLNQKFAKTTVTRCQYHDAVIKTEFSHSLIQKRTFLNMLSDWSKAPYVESALERLSD